MLTLLAPAKLNLFLRIIGRREDGYHLLQTVFQLLDYGDELQFRPRPDNAITLALQSTETTAPGFAELDNIDDNLVLRAARNLQAHSGCRRGADITLIKRLPVGGGLGGGSSDAAATLLLLNDMHASPLSLTELHEMAVKLGADVPFFLYARPSLARGIGDILEPINEWPEFWYVIITPPIKVSTAWVYKNYRLELTTNEYEFIVNLLKSDSFAVSHILENDLERVTSARFSIVNTLKQLLMDSGAEGAIMSGSGPSVFGLFLSKNQAISAKDNLLTHQLGDVFMAKGWETTAHDVQ